MPRLKLPNIDDVVAIDIHTHAEEPCGLHGDDGYDDFQAQMAAYFKSPNKHPPTVAETAVPGGMAVGGERPFCHFQASKRIVPNTAFQRTRIVP